MTEFAGIFEVLASDQRDARLASRKALVLSRDRIDVRLGKFLAASRSAEEFDARYDLVAEDFAGIVRVAADEVGHGDPDSLIETLRDHYRVAGKPPWLEDDDDDEDTEEPKSKKDKKKDKKKDDDDSDEDDDTLEFAAKTHVADKGNTGLSGPSPKMKKQRWTPKSVPHSEYDGGKNEVGDHEEQDVLDNSPNKNLTSPAKDIPATGAAKEEKLPSASNYDDSGFAGNNQEMAPRTKTFGDGGQTKPVTQEALASIPPGYAHPVAGG